MRNKTSNKIKYKFDFGNKFRCFILYFVELLANFGAIIFSWFAFFALFTVVNNYFKNDFIIEITLKILIILMVFIDIFFAVLIFLPKSVVLTDDKIIVYRFCVQLECDSFEIRSLNDRIPYSKIISCKKFEDKIQFGDSRIFYCSSKNSLVEIKTKHRIYIIPLKECDNFVEEVNARVFGHSYADNSSLEL